MENIVRKFNQTMLVENVKTLFRARLRHAAENFVLLLEKVAENPDTSHRSQDLNSSKTTLHQYITKYLLLHAYKILLIKELKPDENLKRLYISQLRKSPT